MSNPTKKNASYGSINMTSERKKFKFTGTSLKKIDYVIVYSKSVMDQYPDKNEEREKFQSALKNRGFTLEETESPTNEDHIYVKLMASYELLCEEAEKIKLEMPIEVNDTYDDDNEGVFSNLINFFETDTEVDFITAPYMNSRKHIFQNYLQEDDFFMNRLRLYLTNHIVIRLDLEGTVNRSKENLGKRKALPYLLMRKVYLDWVILHDMSIDDPYLTDLKNKWIFNYHPDYDSKKQEEKIEMIENGQESSGTPSVNEINKRFDFELDRDPRHGLNETWPKLYKFQPSWRIRNYFGEKVAFYYCWSGHLIAYLWVPMLLGLVIFIYGLYENITKRPTKIDVSQNVNASTSVLSAVENMLNTFKLAFDNSATPFFALLICVWGTILTETWKRHKHRLAYEWDVDSFDTTEPDRAQFKPTVACRDPVTKEETMTYPTYRRLIKFGASLITLLFMITIVLITVAGVIVYRVVVTVKVCPSVSSTSCLILNMILSALMNAAGILILGKLYDLIAFYLTEWENHRTQTDYDDALIIKLFAFQFANSYTSLFYIAFFRGQSFVQSNGILELGPEYVDNCGTNNNCMAMLSFQVFILMIAKPIPKFFKDIVLPKLLEAIRKCRKKNKINSLTSEDIWEPEDINRYINYQLSCTKLYDFTIDEYMEKVIQYGFLMLFAASFPLAPLVAFLTNLCDRYVDAKRLLWMYRRPVPFMVQTIGIWEPILELVNAAGVISNACLIAFTSNWGKSFSFTNKLIIIIAVEHAVFFLKFFLAAVIPDVPADVSLNMRREKFQIEKILESEVGSAKPTLQLRESLLYGSVEDYPGQGEITLLPNQKTDNNNSSIDPMGKDNLDFNALNSGPNYLLPLKTVPPMPSDLSAEESHSEYRKKRKRRKEKRRRKNSQTNQDGQTGQSNSEVFSNQDNYQIPENTDNTDNRI